LPLNALNYDDMITEKSHNQRQTERDRQKKHNTQIPVSTD